MPRTVDHEQRRDELVDAAWGLILDDGLAGVTIRRLAERSGWSSGAVRHYLPTRESIVDAAGARVSTVIGDRVEAALAAARPGGDWTLVSARAAVVDILLAVLPTDQVSRRASAVWLAFVGQAASDASLAQAQGVVYNDLHEALVDVLTDLTRSTFARVPSGADEAAAELMAVVDGLTIHLLLGRVSVERARRVVAAVVGRLIEGRDA